MRRGDRGRARAPRSTVRAPSSPGGHDMASGRRRSRAPRPGYRACELLGRAGRARGSGATARSSRSARASSWRTRSRVMPRLAADLLERPRLLAVEAEAEREHAPHARVQAASSACGELASSAGSSPWRSSGVSASVSSIRSPYEALAVADRRLEADRVLDEVEQLLDALLGEAALLGELLERRVAVELLRRGSAAQRITRRTCSATCTGRRIVRPWSASARVTAWRIHQVA